MYLLNLVNCAAGQQLAHRICRLPLGGGGDMGVGVQGKPRRVVAQQLLVELLQIQVGQLVKLGIPDVRLDVTVDIAPVGLMG